MAAEFARHVNEPLVLVHAVRDEAQKNLPGLYKWLGWPLPADTGGGGWIYHMQDNLVSIGLPACGTRTSSMNR